MLNSTQKIIAELEVIGQLGKSAFFATDTELPNILQSLANHAANPGMLYPSEIVYEFIAGYRGQSKQESKALEHIAQMIRDAHS